ncbi:MAG: DNA polymerase III subunit [Dehalococcoidia bacterium]
MWQTAGQDRIIKIVKGSLELRSLAHAYLFVGPAHVGKMTLALDLARALNCNSGESPCGSCRTCQRIGQGIYSDVIIIDKNTGRDPKDRKKASEISIDTIRELMQRGSNLPPYEGKYKVFIIEDADLMSEEAANCLLKTLEEPPPYILIILLTSEEHKLLPTVLSRCQRFELKPVAVAQIEEKLSSREGVPNEKVKLLARLSGGCLGWALNALDNEGYLINRKERFSDFVSLLGQNWDERLSFVQQLPSDRSNAEEILKLWLLWCRDVLLVKYNCDEAVINIDCIHDLKAWANVMTVPEIKEFIDCLNRAVVNLNRNANLHLLFEVIMLDMPRKEKRGEYAINSSR